MKRFFLFRDIELDLVGNDDVFGEFQSGPAARHISNQTIRRGTVFVVVDTGPQDGPLAGRGAALVVRHCGFSCAVSERATKSANVPRRAAPWTAGSNDRHARTPALICA